MSNRLQRWLFEELMKPIVLAGALVERVIGPILLPGAIRVSKERERDFEIEIRRYFPFLFEEFNGEATTDESLPHPRSFDGASIVVTSDDLLFRFTRGRGDLSVCIAPSRAPEEWADLSALLSLVAGKDSRRVGSFLFLSDVAIALKPHMAALREVFSPDRYPELKRQLAEGSAYEKAAIRQWESEINERLHR